MEYEIYSDGDIPMLLEVDLPTRKYLGSAFIYIKNKKQYDLLIDVPVTKFYPGKDYAYDSPEGTDYADGNGDVDGANCLIHIQDNVYMHVSQDIILFSLFPGEKVKEYICFIGYDKPPIAYLVTNKNVYFFGTNEYINKNCLSRSNTTLPARALYAKYVEYRKNSNRVHDMEFDTIFSYYRKDFYLDTSDFQELGIVNHHPKTCDQNPSTFRNMLSLATDGALAVGMAGLATVNALMYHDTMQAIKNTNSFSYSDYLSLGFRHTSMLSYEDFISAKLWGYYNND